MSVGMVSSYVIGSLLAVTTLVLPLGCSGLDNGIARTPPKGFRTWNQFGLNVSQDLMMSIYASMIDRSRLVDGQPTSLLDVGYQHASIDDGWQACNSGPSGRGFHNASGYPTIDTEKFPNVRAMTAQARKMGITPGFYANNCHCADHSKTCTGSDACYEGDVASTIDWDFGG